MSSTGESVDMNKLPSVFLTCAWVLIAAPAYAAVEPPPQPSPTPEPQCSISGPFEACFDGEDLALQMDGSSSTVPDFSEAGYFWSTDCPGASFSDASTVTPMLNIPYSSSVELPELCQVQLSVSAWPLLRIVEPPSVVSCMTNVVLKSCQEPTCVMDACGVCDGDGSSCLDCDEVDITPLQLSIDSNADMHAGLVQRAARQLVRRSGRDANARRFANRQVRRADRLSKEVWTQTWTIPNVLSFCETSVLCVSVSNVGFTSEAAMASTRMQRVLRRTVRRLRRESGRPRAGRNLLDRGAALLEQNLLEIERVPESYSSCQ